MRHPVISAVQQPCCTGAELSSPQMLSAPFVPSPAFSPQIVDPRRRSRPQHLLHDPPLFHAPRLRHRIACCVSSHNRHSTSSSSFRLFSFHLLHPSESPLALLMSNHPALRLQSLQFTCPDAYISCY